MVCGVLVPKKPGSVRAPECKISVFGNLMLQKKTYCTDGVQAFLLSCPREATYTVADSLRFTAYERVPHRLRRRAFVIYALSKYPRGSLPEFECSIGMWKLSSQGPERRRASRPVTLK
ncbi:unnamed protein product [Nippostrongylus brasiliensis]|uniref:Uncharacterized protein n=1 Tax=Nippostrongylus brasiliensis TaxID=27835 RepID=A0A0N4Y1F0_NIPBR|nr:unnamed protein product [Nippostrongylus brasiliensis]